jgi:hypothetical protein
MSSALVCLAAAVMMSGCGFGIVATGETRHETMSLDLGKSANIRAAIRMGAGELRVQGGSPKLVDATFTYNVPEWKPVVDYRSVEGELTLSQPSAGAGAFGNTVNEWNLTLNNEVPFDFTANLGAGEATLNLGQMNLTRVDVSIVAPAR